MWKTSGTKTTTTQAHTPCKLSNPTLELVLCINHLAGSSHWCQWAKDHCVQLHSFASEEGRVLVLDGETCLTPSGTARVSSLRKTKKRMLNVLIFVFNRVSWVKSSMFSAWGTNLYVDFIVVSLCLVSADTRGLGPQQLETIWFDKSTCCYGPGTMFFFSSLSISLLTCRPSGEVYQEWLKKIDWNVSGLLAVPSFLQSPVWPSPHFSRLTWAHASR